MRRFTAAALSQVAPLASRTARQCRAKLVPAVIDKGWRLLWLMLCCVPTLAWADLLPAVHYELKDRMRNNPQTYDRADQFCAKRRVGSPCVIPGNPFEGGGEGECQTSPNNQTRTIDSLCVRKERVEISREIPREGYKGSDAYCERDRKEAAAHAASPYAQFPRPVLYGCGPTSTVPDRFCNGKVPGDACTAEVKVDDTVSSFAGRCMERHEEAIVISREVMTRTVLLCLPEKPVVIDISPSSPPNWFQRLFE